MKPLYRIARARRRQHEQHGIRGAHLGGEDGGERQAADGEGQLPGGRQRDVGILESRGATRAQTARGSPARWQTHQATPFQRDAASERLLVRRRRLFESVRVTGRTRVRSRKS